MSTIDTFDEYDEGGNPFIGFYNDEDRDKYRATYAENKKQAEIIEGLHGTIKSQKQTADAMIKKLVKQEEVVEAMREFLECLPCHHDGNQPMALDISDLDYARRVIRTIHREGRKALKAANELKGDE